MAEAIIETLQSTRQNVLIQRFVKESKGRDIRALVVGDRVVAAMRRVAQGDEFRSNVHRGGSVEPVELDEEFERGGRALRADHGPARRRRRHARGQRRPAGDGGQLLARASRASRRATKLDVAGAIIDYIDNQVAFPAHRRTPAADASRPATAWPRSSSTAAPTWSARPSATRACDERDITVLTLHRGTQVIPNPRDKTVLEAEDRLLCFGKLEEMRSMIPDRKQQAAGQATEKKHLPPAQ